MTEIAEGVRRLVAEHLGLEPETVTDEAHILDDLGADSLDTVEIVLCLEEEFGIEISDDLMENTNTVGEVIALVQRLKTPN